MRRTLYISIALYPLIVLAALVALFGDFRQDSFGPPAFQALFLVWLLDGFVCLVAGVGVALRLFKEGFEWRSSPWQAVLAIVAVLLGLPPAYILLELINKLARFYFKFG